MLCLPTSFVVLLSSFCIRAEYGVPSEVRYPQGHLSLSALSIECRYARRPILAIRICVITELMALYVPLCVSSVALPGLTPRRKSSFPCLAVSQDAFHSAFMVLRMADLAGAISARRCSGSGGGSAVCREFALWPAASFPGTPTCAGIHRNCTSQPWPRSSSSAWMASARMYCPDGCFRFRIAWMAAWGSA